LRNRIEQLLCVVCPIIIDGLNKDFRGPVSGLLLPVPDTYYRLVSAEGFKQKSEKMNNRGQT